MSNRIAVKGDAIKDVAFLVQDAKAIYDKAVSRGAVSVLAPTELKDENGSVIIATIRAYNDTDHSFVQRNDYKGLFMPGYIAPKFSDPLAASLPSPRLDFIDHIVGNQADLEMEPVCAWYEKMLDFHRFWSVDDKQMSTQYSGMLISHIISSSAIALPHRCYEYE